MLRKDRDFLVASEITRHELHRRRKLDHYRLEFTVNKLRAESIVSALDENEGTAVSWNQKIEIDETVLYAERLMRAHIRLDEELEWPELIDRAYKVASLRLADASRAINLYTTEVDQTDGATGLDEIHRALLIKLNTAYNDVKLLSRHVSEMVDTDAEVTSLEYPSAPSNKTELLQAERVLLEAEIAAIRQRTVTALFFQIMNEEYLTALQEELDWIEKGVSRYEVRRRGKIEDLRREKVTSLVELKRLESLSDLGDLDKINLNHHRKNIALKNEQLAAVRFLDESELTEQELFTSQLARIDADIIHEKQQIASLRSSGEEQSLSQGQIASEIELYRERVAQLLELREAISMHLSSEL